MAYEGKLDQGMEATGPITAHLHEPVVVKDGESTQGLTN